MITFEPLTNPRIKDMTGLVFGKLTVLGFAGIRPKKTGSDAKWWVQCSCGSSPFICISVNLNRGHTVSCGCKKKEQLAALKIDLVGLSFGNLTVLGQAPNRIGDRATYWECSCICGKTTIVKSGSLRQGKTNSCGCLQHDH
jgi:hypothetical protein